MGVRVGGLLLDVPLSCGDGPDAFRSQDQEVASDEVVTDTVCGGRRSDSSPTAVQTQAGAPVSRRLARRFRGLDGLLQSAQRSPDRFLP